MPNNISVILSVFNGEKHIANAIESVLNQSFEDFEFLILDDASTDNTYNIIKSYQNIDKRIELLKNNSNIGLTKSLNTLISKSKYEYIARQDADDLSLVERFSSQLTVINSGDYDAVTTRAIIKGENTYTPNYSYYLPRRFVMKIKNPFIHGSLMIKKTVLYDLGKYNEKFYYAQDYKLMSDLVKKNYKTKIIKEPLYVLNQKNNISTNFKNSQEYFANCVKKNIDPEINI
jgi:glycosyltransferase involved in cell wall biosynthesis